MNISAKFQNRDASIQQIERLTAAHAAYATAIDANGSRKGGESLATVSEVHRTRNSYIDELSKCHEITPEMFSDICRNGRAKIASELWGICSAKARETLLKDQHHFVKSCAVISQSDFAIQFTGSRNFNSAHQYIGGEVTVQFWTNCPTRSVRVLYDLTAKSFVYLKARYDGKFKLLSGIDSSCLNELIQEDGHSKVLEDFGFRPIASAPLWLD